MVTVYNCQCQDTRLNIAVCTLAAGRVIADPPATSPSPKREGSAGRGLGPKNTDVSEQSPAVFPSVWVSPSEKGIVGRDNITLVKV